jgi:uncharacterized protein YcbX
MVTVSELWQYPFKSGKGIALASAQFDAQGMCGDRRLVALDENGAFITARSHGQLLQLACTQTEEGWMLEHPKAKTFLHISHDSSCSMTKSTANRVNKTINGQLWDDDINGVDAGNEAAIWLSAVLNMKVRVAIWQSQSRISAKYQLETNFSDAAPILVTTQESLLATSDFAGVTLDMRRFRPNIVLSGAEAFAEESWQQLKIGKLTFDLLDTCTRCILTTRDPDTGEARRDMQPLRGLKRNHTNAQREPIFGVNAKLLLPVTRNKIYIGDEVTFV